MSGLDEERQARAVLTSICEPGHLKLARLISEHGPIATVDALRCSGTESAWGQRARKADGATLLVEAKQWGIRFVIPGDEEWPVQLDDLEHGAEVQGLGGIPVGLWVAGPWSLRAWARSSVAVVGARAATRYGEAVASDLAAHLASGPGEYSVVSGGAYGIDAAAHRGAMVCDGRTIGVYAGGLDEPYPRGNARLFEELKGKHVVVSEVAPGIHVTRAAFLARNRLIAALTVGTVVVEAAARSGARNTASWAAALGRVVMAVPGSVHSAMSVGCHRLIRDGQATLVCDADDVKALLAPVGLGPDLPERGADRVLDDVDPHLLAIREAMPARGAVGPPELAEKCGQTVPRVVAGLVELEILGLVKQDEQGMWRLKRPTAGKQRSEATIW